MKIRDFLDKIGVKSFDEAYELFKRANLIQNHQVKATDIFNEEEIKELGRLGLL